MSINTNACTIEPEAGHSSHLFEESFRESVNDTGTSTSTDKSLELASTSSAIAHTDTSPSSSLKRPRDAGDSFLHSGSDSNSNSLSDSSRSESDASPSPFKRRKRQYEEDETPASTPEPMRTPKKVRFHPETFDNSLWADLIDVKYASERPPTPYRVSSPPPVLGNVMSEPSSSTIASRPLTTAPSSIPTRASIDAEREQLSLRPSRSRRQLSRNRAKSFLARKSWNDFDFDADAMKGNPRDVEDDTSSMYTEAGDRSRHDCDDVSVPRSSPPPSVRIMAMGISAADANREQATMDAKRKRDANAELPSIYTRPSRSIFGTYDRTASIMTTGGDSKSSKPRQHTKEEVTRYGVILLNALSKLPAEEARASKEALEVVTRYQGKCSFEAGYREGLRVRQTEKVQASEESST